MPSKNGIIIFTKNPELGKVKTRLAKDIGDQRALEIYIELLDYTRKIALASSAEKHLFYSNKIHEKDDWSSTDFVKHLQSNGDLGDRMTKAFVSVLAKHEKAVIIGSDCPQITPEIIDSAFLALDNKDVVIGPTLDGGYYLLGVKKLYPFLYDNIPWSSGSEYETTLRRCLSNKLSIEILQSLSDIDYLEDWEKYGW